MVTFAQAFGPLAIAPIFPQLVQDFHSDLAGVVHFTGVTILVLGFSNFVWWVYTSLVSILFLIVCVRRVDRR